MFNQKKSEELEKRIAKLEDFESNLIHVGGKNKDKTLKRVAEYLSLRNKHACEDLTIKIMPPEEKSQIDTKALAERQEQELQDFWKKNAAFTEPSGYPAK